MGRGHAGACIACLIAYCFAAAAETACAASQVDEEVVVTARGREENLQQAPVSVVTFSASELDARAVTNLGTLQNFVPNVTFAPSQNVGEAAGNIFIRGIGQEDFIAGTEPGVGLYLDGVYLARPIGALMNLLDVSRIEVLRGPQGTLYGKNTVGGAVNILSVMPQPEREHRLVFILGSFDRREVRAVVNEPVAGNLLLRLSAGSVSRGGYFRRLSPPFPLTSLSAVNGNRGIDNAREGREDGLSGRLQLRWRATPSFPADLSVDGTHKSSTQGATRVDAIDTRFGIFPHLNRLIREGVLPGPEITNGFLPDSFYESYAGGKNFSRLDAWGASATAAKILGMHTFKSIVSYREQQSRIGTDTDGIYYNVFQSEFRDDQQQYSAELQASGAVGAFSYVVGLLTFGERIRSLPSSGIGQNEILYTCNCFYAPGSAPPAFTVRRRLTSESYAAYAEGSLPLLPRVTATLGARFSHELKSIHANSFAMDLVTLQPTSTVAGSGANADAWDAFTYRAGLAFQATADAMLYGTVAKGYKSGGFNVRPSSNLPNLGLTPFSPETALMLEGGLRSEWWDRKLTLNATVFQTDYADIQLRQQTIVSGITTTLIENAAKARIRGAEVEVVLRPLEGLALSAAYGRLAPRYLDVGRVPGITLQSRFQRTPDDSLAVAFDYEIRLAPGTVAIHGDYTYRSKEQFQLSAAAYDQPGYALVGGRIAFGPTDERWSLALFATNLTGEKYRTAGRGTLLSQIGYAYSSIGAPRQIGVRLAASF